MPIFTRIRQGLRNLSGITLFLMLFIGFSAPSLMAASAGKPSMVKLERTADNEYARLMLPARMIGAGIKDSKDLLNETKFEAIEKFDDIFANKLFASTSVAGVTVPFFLAYEAEKPGQERNGALYFGPAAKVVHDFYKGRYDAYLKDPKAKDPKAKPLTEQQLMQEMMIALKGGDGKKDVKKDTKKDTKKDAKGALPAFSFPGGKPSEGQHVVKGRMAPLPHGLGDTDNSKYWSSSLAPVSAAIDIYTSPTWSADMKRGTPAEKYRVFVIFPTGKNHNCGYLRSGTALSATVGKDKVRVDFFDDNLNGIFGEPGKDSVRVGGALSLSGSTLSVGSDVFTVAIDLEKGASLRLTPHEEKTGKVQLTWLGAEGSTLHYAILKSTAGEAYYGLTLGDSKKPASSPSAKKEGGESKVVFTPVTIPAGTYQLVGGLVGRKTKEMKSVAYASLVGTQPITVEEGKTFPLSLGGKLTSAFSIQAQKDERIVGIGFLKGEGQEEYRSILPVPEEAKLQIKGKPGSNFEDPLQKIMGVTTKGNLFMDTIIKYDPVLFPVENGPFLFFAKVDPLVFDLQTITGEQKNMDGK